MKIRDRFLTIAAVAVIVIILAGAGVFAPHGPRKDPPATAAQLEGRMLGGVAGRMPSGSSEIFFESMLGCNLAGYKSYGSYEEALYALKSGEVEAIWAADVTAGYLLAQDDSLRLVDISGTAAIQQTSEPRTEFGLAMKNDKAGRALAESVDGVLNRLKDSGELDTMIASGITDAAGGEGLFTEQDMKTGTGGRLVIGITGAVPPIEMTDSDGRPCGFCVQLSDRIARELGMTAELVVLDGETVFSSLMSGRIDAVFCYGTGRITTEGDKQWVTTLGYYPMQRYEFLTYNSEE